MMPLPLYRAALPCLLGLCVYAVAAPADLDTKAATVNSSDVPPPETLKEELLSKLPPAVAEGLDVDAWLWMSYLHNDQSSDNNIYDLQLSLDVTKTFGRRVATSFEGNFIDANGERRVELEQGFISFLLSEKSQTLLTVGKFNANFGVEARDFWNRTNGTTSLLFAAQPQDLIGVMITQPIGNTGITLRPFITADFQGAYNFDQPPSFGMTVEYRPNNALTLAVTNWVGPGMVLYEGRPLRAPFKGGEYGSSDVVENWQGPNLYAERGGTLYFMDAKAIWQPRPDLMLAAEYLVGSTSVSEASWGWWGAMALAHFDITDRLGVFARFSYLDDRDWLVSGEYQRLHEISGGVGYRINKYIEVRGEYRHDHGTVTGDSNSVSVHLAMGY